jgi:hypothetical protein
MLELAREQPQEHNANGPDDCVNSHFNFDEHSSGPTARIPGNENPNDNKGFMNFRLKGRKISASTFPSL